MGQKKPDKINFYVCDPQKNIHCDGRAKPTCGTMCFCTINPEFAKDPAKPLTKKEYDTMAELKRKFVGNVW